MVPLSSHRPREKDPPRLHSASGDSSRPLIGIPRGLLYFSYQPLWTTYLETLGLKTRVSAPTQTADLARAQGLTRSELCLPVKVFLDHVARIKDEVDWLLMPRMVSVDPDAFMCPKVLGLADMVRNVFSDHPPLLDPKVNVKPPKPQGLEAACRWIGGRFTEDPELLAEAWASALKAQARFEERMCRMPLDEALAPWDPHAGRRSSRRKGPVRYNIAVIGRPYLTFDRALSRDLLSLLEGHGARILTPEAVPASERERLNSNLPKKVYWQLGKHLVASALHYMNRPDVDGIVNVTSFGCGQDSFTAAMVEHYVGGHSRKPLLNLVLDEHTADVGLRTRVEAFLDVIDRQRRALGPGRHLPAGSSRKQGRAFRPAAVTGGTDMHLTIPHMGYLHRGFEPVLRRLGAKITMPPRPNREALTLGTRYAPEGACLPFKLNLGNMIQALEKGATDIIVPAGFGPCRYGYYSVIQEQILRDLGYRFRMGRTDDPDSLKDMLATIRTIAGLNSKWDSYRLFLFILHRIALMDRALSLVHRLKPRETEPRAADRALERCLKVIEDTRRFKDLWRARRETTKILGRVPVEHQRPVLRVGVVGEIFMLLENYANMNVEDRLGEMGVEVHRGVWLSDWLNDRFRFKLFRRNQFNWSQRMARPYLRDPSGGESTKSVGKSVYFARQGFDGIVHLMPFTCMPELVAQTILGRVSEDLGIPILTLIFDEHTSAGAVQTRLEAFVDLMARRKRRIPRD